MESERGTILSLSPSLSFSLLLYLRITLPSPLCASFFSGFHSPHWRYFPPLLDPNGTK